jgi:hypothetical protein
MDQKHNFHPKLIDFIILIILIIISSTILYKIYKSYQLFKIKNKIFPFEIESVKISSIEDNIYYELFKPFTSNLLELEFLIKYKIYIESPQIYSMARNHEIDQMHMLIKNIIKSKVPGDIIETGVWRGGMCMWIKALLNYNNNYDRHLWLFDVFGPFPKAKHSIDKKIDPIVRILFDKVPNVSQVKNNFRKFNLLDDKVHFIQGDFADTIPNTQIVNGIAILRLDGDYYDSTLIVLENYYKLINSGGYVIIDDYNNKHLGCKTAVDEFRLKNNITNTIISNGIGSVYWQV